MNTQRKLLSFILMFALTVSLIQPCAQTTVLAEDTNAAEMTFTVKNKRFYNTLKECFPTNVTTPVCKNYNDKAQTITLDMDKIKTIDIRRSIDMAADNSAEILEQLVCKSTNLTTLCLKDCDLSQINLSFLKNAKKLSYLHLINTNFVKVPDLKLENVSSLYLSKNNFSADDAFDNLTRENFPALTSLYMDACRITNVEFLKNMEGLKSLSLGNNKLTDESITALLDMETNDLSTLTTLYLGKIVHTYPSGMETTLWGSSSNHFTNTANLALLPARLPKLTYLDLQGLELTSLRDFVDLREGISIIFSGNHISDFAGLKSDNNFTITEQRISLSDDYGAGWEYELPELLQRILDENDVLSGTLSYTGCKLSDDGTKLVINHNVTEAYVKVNRGKLRNSEIHFNLTREPAPEPEPEPTPTPTPVTPTVSPVTPTKIPTTPSPIPVTSSPSPVVPTETPATQTPSPLIPTKTPATPTPVPVTPTPSPSPAAQAKASATPSTAPEIPAQTLVAPTPSPTVPTQKPDESSQNGNQLDKRKDLSLSLAAGRQKGNRGIQLTWGKWTGCSGYEVYWSYCNGSKQNYKKLKTVTSTEKRLCIHKKLKTNRAYKYFIAVYQIKDGNKTYLAKSPVIHVAMRHEGRTNIKSIQTNKSAVTLSPQKTFQLKASASKENKKKKLLTHDSKFRYYTDDREVASVTKTGKIRAVKQGTCSVYIIANNGVSKKITVTVK